MKLLRVVSFFKLNAHHYRPNRNRVFSIVHRQRISVLLCDPFHTRPSYPFGTRHRHHKSSLSLPACPSARIQHDTSRGAFTDSTTQPITHSTITYATTLICFVIIPTTATTFPSTLFASVPPSRRWLWIFLRKGEELSGRVEWCFGIFFIYYFEYGWILFYCFLKNYVFCGFKSIKYCKCAGFLYRKYFHKLQVITEVTRIYDPRHPIFLSPRPDSTLHTPAGDYTSTRSHLQPQPCTRVPCDIQTSLQQTTNIFVVSLQKR
jgi:hypothetical protein